MSNQGSNADPVIGSRWMRSTTHDPASGDYNAYTIIAITNTANIHPNHPPQVIYKGDNGNMWSLPLERWPGSLVPEPPGKCPRYSLSTDGETTDLSKCPSCGGPADNGHDREFPPNVYACSRCSQKLVGQGIMFAYD